MAGLINQLLDILNEQATRYEELLGLSQEKRDVIVANDIDTLQKITHLENLVVSQNQKLEKKRQAVMKDMSMVLNKKESELTLKALIDLLDGQAEQKELIAVGDRMRTTLGALSEANVHNASLIENALDYVEFSINVIRSTADRHSPFYMPNGETIHSNPGVFDTRN